ncbi:hypothetical protein [Methanococcus sp. CF]
MNNSEAKKTKENFENELENLFNGSKQVENFVKVSKSNENSENKPDQK